MPVMDLQQAVSRRKDIVEFTKSIMVSGVDYGEVPGTDKPTLLKPGAEKLTTFFGLSPRFVVIKEVERWGDDGKEPFLYYWYKCQLFRGDLLVGEGDGSCNSRESKYRWRWVGEEDLPLNVNPDLLRKREGKTSEFTFAVDKAETSGKYGKPQSYWEQFNEAIKLGKAVKIQKSTSKGAVYPAWEISTTVYRVPNEDIASQANTILKMAQKRALVAATLIAVNASEFFTQDIEDMDFGDVIEGSFAEVTTPPPTPAPIGKDPADLIAKGKSTPAPPEPKHWIDDPKVRNRFWAWTGGLGLDSTEVHDALGVISVKDFGGTMDEAKSMIETYVEQRAAQPEAEPF